ncbi:diversity-generating retroelement protein Avd [Chloroflexus sp. Y-396-1]|uniref:diversity-generating retroelement protein Avd n=1 Tax=Chloroflexus sp. Y-396-1 TaxID=867845 RepID=UPI0004B238AB|nr:diversity-generating retroelement protein Avd [Chloroflexus sp. Y-396-1]
MNNIPLFAKTYDLLRWLIPTTLKYPREHRFALALRTQQAAFEFNELIVMARKSRDKRELLIRADAHLEQLRLYVRLAHDLKLLSLRQYEYVSREISGLGALLGDWMKRSGVRFSSEQSRDHQDRSSDGADMHETSV